MMNKSIKTIGLILFVAGFLLFNSLFFLSSFTLTEEIISARIADSAKRELFLNASASLSNQTKSNSFDFIDELKQIFNNANQEIYGIYGITEEELIELT